MKNKRGFTLVELAVVLTIIALLIGGVLKGQELADLARVTETVARAKAIDTAMRNFRTVYGAIPGDMKGASARLPDCNENCEPDPNGAGDSLIGDTQLGYFKTHQMALSHPPNHQNKETLLFWLHLMKANMISGISDRPLYEENVTSEFGVTHPVAKVGGGFIISSGSRGVNDMIPETTTMYPYELIITTKAAQDIPGGLNPTSNEQPMTPLRAAQLDRKLDDGNPASGDVKAIGYKPTCFEPVSTGIYRYDQTVAKRDCGVVIRIQN